MLLSAILASSTLQKDKFCDCGVRLHPEDDIISIIKARLKALIAPYYAAKVNRSKSAKHGDNHRKAMDTK